MILLLLLFTGSYGKQNFQFELVFSDKMATATAAGLLDKGMYPNAITCVRACSKYQGCASVFYLKNTMCSFRSETFTNSSSASLRDHPGAQYYIWNGPPVTEGAACPADIDGFQPAVLSDGTVFRFRVFLDNYINHTNAVALCASHGARLYKIVTEAKLAFTRELLTCPGYSSTGYWFWVDGEYNGNDYRTTDGERIPMTSSLWLKGQPSDPGNENCIYLEYTQNYRFKDGECFSQYQTICEI